MRDHGEYCGLLEAEVDRLAEAIAGAEPGALVPGCDDWTALDLAQHIGLIHRWTIKVVESAATARVPLRDVPVDFPEDWADYPGWVAEGGARLVTALRAVDGDAPVWTWGPDQRMRWWSRRQFHETMVHRADAEGAAGKAPVFDPAQAADAIDEFLANIPHGRASGPAIAALTTPGTLHLHATDAEGEWTIRFGPEGYSWERGHLKADAAVRGQLADLLLFTFGRQNDAPLEIFGDRALLDAWTSASRF
ncbi:maleylpyruvate isomerase family mycothiol-dependent enzyme [Actinocorallia sp. A-T 12471]|uniref:maleylpyruvate isomerase family mycothiol-dependent enzyme n=1 Tax=Actinocorallia sp. A-T 12471 TaxID=3089813 RepID=UPI0029D09965|nr:maleylpyruvate isomerase family mycothiol-dependent enzyme [Actinocorallia sp. A-T 12471]MDX6740077.1 maleylpyruvate isomerase family mycothiol-dependent enzyme [Actinocorallia sp. A-T 12471]